MDKRLRDQLRVIENEGFTVTRVAPQGNSHFRAYVNTTIGERFITMGCSPSGGAGGGAFIVKDRCRKLKREIATTGEAGARAPCAAGGSERKQR